MFGQAAGVGPRDKRKRHAAALQGSSDIVRVAICQTDIQQCKIEGLLNQGRCRLHGG